MDKHIFFVLFIGLLTFSAGTKAGCLNDTIHPRRHNVLFYVNGKEVPDSVFYMLNPEFVESFEVLKKEEELKAYGERGKNGVALVTLKTSNIKDAYLPTLEEEVTKLLENKRIKRDKSTVSYIIDGKKLSSDDVAKAFKTRGNYTLNISNDGTCIELKQIFYIR